MNYLPFENWGNTVKNTPHHTFFPKTVCEIQNIIKWANKTNKKVRCSGYRHTWNNMFSDNNQVLLAMIPLHQSNMGSKKTSKSELTSITLLEYPTSEPGLVKLGASVDNEDFKEWCKLYGVCIPMNVIMTENTIAGMVSTMSHGSGIKTKTMSDLVYAIEIVDYKGRLRKYDRKSSNIMNVISGGLGMCGVIVSVTFYIYREMYALMNPTSIEKEIGLIRNWKEQCDERDWERSDGIGQDQKERCDDTWKRVQSSAALSRRINENHYNEFFWFPFSENIWINTWKTSYDSNFSQVYPNKCESITQKILSKCGEFAINNLAPWISPRQQCNLFSKVAMSTLPTTPKKTHIMDALHFRHGIHDMRVRNYEIEIPVTKTESISDIWWTAIDEINRYASMGKYPVRVALEMRIMGGSDIILAPQKGNQITCSVEILSTMDVSWDEWLEFINNLVDKWCNKYKGCRPHWAKGWEGTMLYGKPVIDALRDIYSDEIKRFRKVIEDEDLDAVGMFSNELLGKIFT